MNCIVCYEEDKLISLIDYNNFFTCNCKVENICNSCLSSIKLCIYCRKERKMEPIDELNNELYKLFQIKLISDYSHSSISVFFLTRINYQRFLIFIQNENYNKSEYLSFIKFLNLNQTDKNKVNNLLNQIYPIKIKFYTNILNKLLKL